MVLHRLLSYSTDKIEIKEKNWACWFPEVCDLGGSFYEEAFKGTTNQRELVRQAEKVPIFRTTQKLENATMTIIAIPIEALGIVSCSLSLTHSLWLL
jgi:hypothetical protein